MQELTVLVAIASCERPSCSGRIEAYCLNSGCIRRAKNTIKAIAGPAGKFPDDITVSIRVDGDGHGITVVQTVDEAIKCLLAIFDRWSAGKIAERAESLGSEE